MFDVVKRLVPGHLPALRANRHDRHLEQLRAVHAQGDRGSRQLHTSDGKSLPVLPFLTVSVSNKNSRTQSTSCSSTFPSTIPLEVTLGVQLDVLLALRVRTPCSGWAENWDLITRVDCTRTDGQCHKHICFRCPRPSPALPR